jgi:hypothetical protein
VQAAHGLHHVILSSASGGVTLSDFVKKPFWRCRTFERTRTRRPGNDQRTGRYGFCQLEHGFFRPPPSVRDAQNSLFAMDKDRRSASAKSPVRDGQKYAL